MFKKGINKDGQNTEQMGALAAQLLNAHELFLDRQKILFKCHISAFVDEETILDDALFEDFYAKRSEMIQIAFAALENHDSEFMNWMERHSFRKISPEPQLDELLEAGMTKAYLFAGLRVVAGEYQLRLRQELLGDPN